jgi:hypothetical protein
MKFFNNTLPVIGLLGLGAMLSSCEHTVQIQTRVEEDGKLDKTIILESKDSLLDKQNYFGISDESGWNVTREHLRDSTLLSNSQGSYKDKLIRYTFTKSFDSAADANKELAQSSDTLFHITSDFKKQFRWFYTYMSYSETYHAINRFKLPYDQYLTKADFEFVNSLPAEGEPISHADSLFLDALNERIFDDYGSRAYFEEYFQIMTDLCQNKSDVQRLQSEKDAIYQSLMLRNDVENDFLPKLADSLHVSIDLRSKEYQHRKRAVEAKFNFASWASEGTYIQVIDIPGTTVTHNADTVDGQKFYWKPSYLKFLFHDYTQYVKTRKANTWAWVVSFFVVIGSLYTLIVRRKS